MEHSLPVLKQQEIPFDSPEFRYLFQPLGEKPFVATTAAIAEYTAETIERCLTLLPGRAALHSGLDYLQVFEQAGSEPL
ncbi:hypothetical protein [Anatilimnocola floriformis]|uniref:hypothetical protein n=1 Tax=Anatilimnocola floriformis TaxID=2948575 RepID=UPI0020C35E78|nr:hypothetical protein [Anatilimnocola floriformis]